MIRLLFICLLTGGLAAWGRADDRPNIIVILVDDLGWKDLGCQGSRFHETPAIDRLAGGGMRFTDFYAAGPVCSPTRAGLLTGRAPARLGLTNVTQIKTRSPRPTDRVVEPERKPALPLEEITLAEILGDQGYACAAIGKWHLGADPGNPKNQGFSTSLAGRNQGSTRYFDPFTFAELPSRKKGEYITQRLTDEAVSFIRTQRDRPFFLYLAHIALHETIQAPPEMIEAARQRVRPDDPQNNPTYAAALRAVDDSVAAIVKCLADLNLQERTLILFTSDNGGMETALGSGEHLTSNLPLREGKATLYEGGLRVPLIANWPGKIAAGTVSSVPGITMDILPTVTALASVPRPDGVALDGMDLSPVLLGGGAAPPERSLHWHFPHYAYHPPCAAIRSGRWKLIKYLDTGGVELYDLAADIGERSNRAGDEPVLVRSLQTGLETWLRDVAAPMPRPNPLFQATVTP